MNDDKTGDGQGGSPLPAETPRQDIVTPGEDEIQQPDKHDRPPQE